MAKRPETSEMDVFTLQLITMSDAASLDVSRGEMPANCSHHDLMRWFSCCSAPSAVLCNPKTSTQQFPRPACVTSAFVCVRHVAHNLVKHVENDCYRRPSSNGLSIIVECVVRKWGGRGERERLREKRNYCLTDYHGASSKIPL